MLKVGNGCPSTMAILENAHGLARYAQIAQVCWLDDPHSTCWELLMLIHHRSLLPNCNFDGASIYLPLLMD